MALQTTARVGCTLTDVTIRVRVARVAQKRRAAMSSPAPLPVEILRSAPCEDYVTIGDYVTKESVGVVSGSGFEVSSRGSRATPPPPSSVSASAR